MKIRQLHDWDVTYREAAAVQEKMRGRLRLYGSGPRKKARTLAGADISYAKWDDLFFAAVIVLDAETLEVIEKASCTGRVRFPYIPGLLTFREGPIILKAFEKIANAPDYVLIDGQGIAHPRGIGFAAHVGLMLDVPTIGCAKTRLFGTYGEPGKKRGEFSHLKDNGSIIGAVLRTKDNVRPLFISQGHRISLARAIEVVLESCRGYRIPEPIRRAHHEVNSLRRGGVSSC